MVVQGRRELLFLWGFRGRGGGNGSNSKPVLLSLVCGNISCGNDQGEEGGMDSPVRYSKSVGQWEDDTPEGWTFFNFASFVEDRTFTL